jgi:hypothetical protein
MLSDMIGSKYRFVKSVECCDIRMSTGHNFIDVFISYDDFARLLMIFGYILLIVFTGGTSYV